MVGSTIRRCTKLFALSRLHWALERTAHTGWHARFGSSHPPTVSPTHCALSSVGSFLTSFYSSPLLSPSHRLAWPLGSRNSGQRMTTLQSQGTKSQDIPQRYWRIIHSQSKIEKYGVFLECGKTCFFLPVGSDLELVFSPHSLTSTVSMLFSARSSEAVIPSAHPLLGFSSLFGFLCSDGRIEKNIDWLLLLFSSFLPDVVE